MKEMCSLTKPHMDISAQAVACSLADVAPSENNTSGKEDTFSEQANAAFSGLVAFQIVKVGACRLTSSLK